MASFVLFGRIVARMCASRTVALLAVLFTLACWQFRSPHDPVIGTSLILPWAACTIFFALDTWQRYSDRRRLIDFILAVVAVALAALTTPYALILAVIFSVTALQSRTFFRTGATLAILTLATVVGSYTVTPNALPWLPGATYVRDVALGIFSAVPASFRTGSNVLIGHVPALYHFGSTGWRYVNDRFITIPPISYTGWIFLGAILLGSWIAIHPRKENTLAQSSILAVVLGGSSWLIPALLINDPSQWHHTLPVGQAFDGVYLEYFGIGILFALFFAHLRGGHGPMARSLPILVIVFLFVTTYGNVRVDAISLQHLHRQDTLRSVLERAGSAGFFAALPSNASLVVSSENIEPFDDGRDISNLRYLLFHYSKRRFTLESQKMATRNSPPNAWLLRIRNDEKLPVTLSHIAKIKARSIRVDRAFGYTYFTDAMLQAISPRTGVVISALPLADGWRLTAHRTCGDVARKSVFAEDRPAIHWTGGFFPGAPLGYGLDPGEPHASGLGYLPSFYTKRYFANTGVLIVVPSACAPETIVATLQAIATGPGSMWVTAQGQTQRIPISTDLTTFTLTLNAPSSRRLPIPVIFRSDAPPGNLTPLTSRYERDVPHDRRVMVEPATFMITPLAKRRR